MELDEILLPDGTTRKLGNNEPPAGLCKSWPIYGDSPKTPLIRREDWKPIDLSRFMPEIKDQNGVGACNAFATISIVEGCRAQQGLPYVRLSPGYLYGRINGGVDRGSMLEDALDWMTQHGTVTAETVKELDWRARPANAVDESKKYRVLEAYLCPTFEHIASALQCGFFVNVGLMWYNTDTPDSDGWLPTSGRGGGGHALARSSLDYRNGVWGAGGPNSWSRKWGKDGYCVIPESRFGRQIGGFWAVRSVTDEGGVIPSPVVSFIS
jgi:hypothetical protein